MISMGRTLVHRNGLRWLVLFVWAEILRRLGRRADRRLAVHEQKHELASFYSADIARVVWTDYDWSRHGEEWTQSEEWRAALIGGVLRPNIPQGCEVLEIGPGAGRWTEELLHRAGQTTIVDVSPTCIRLCQERFRSAPNLKAIVGDGRSLSFAPDASFDRIWSFDVFVHIGPADTGSYLREIERVLRPEAIAVIHHPADAGARGSWRSPMTAAQFAELAGAAGLEVARQFDAWTHEGRRYDVTGTGDVITVLRKR
jgi:ubiquinone/menaquinone biosynthesis C-methylase UbiE